ncbi:hypothetical protein CHS0354_014715 [Potamilus streckersoni]|uniref:Poly [ADP-ribose] polymerase n=1 Tax=Potamilus streckersoni TaxID=2493646 RepID=A0AAE0SQC6_9BIVA|nr:hypothetical protein CHS0354_014715 [Potamilus streckersoni]
MSGKTTQWPSSHDKGKAIEDAEPVYESIKDEHLSREIEVREIPGNATEEQLLNFFENPRKGGGSVEEIQYNQAAHTAIVIFESPESVTEILHKQPCKFLEKTMLISIRATPALPAKETIVKNSENTRVTGAPLSIYVGGFNEETSEDALINYFENKKRTGGGEISSHQMNREEGYIIITFVHSSDAAEVLKHSHTLNNVTLTVRPYITDDKMILVTGLTGKQSEENLQNFMEAKTKAEVQSITFSDDRTKAVVEFPNPCDLNAIKQACAKFKLEGVNLTVCPVSICNCIKVTNVPKGVSEDMITNYFENKRRSGGGTVERVEINHSDGVCLVCFEDHAVVGEVCKRPHEIEKAKVAVQPYHSCLGKPRGHKAKTLPEPISIANFELDKRKFLMKNGLYLSKLENEMAECYSKVIWPSAISDEVLLECTLSSDVEDYMSLVETWAEKCHDCFRSFLDGLQSKVFESNSGEWDVRLEQLGKLHVSQPDKVAVFVDAAKYTVTFVGDKSVMPSIIKQVEEAFAAKQITKKCSVKNWQAKYLLAVSFPDEVIDQNWDVNIQIHDDEVDLTGVENSVNEVTIQMYSRLQKIVTTQATMAQEMLILLQKENVRKKVNGKLKSHMKISYPWEVKDRQLILYASTEEETQEMKKVLESMIETFSVQLEKETSKIINNLDWKKLKDKLNAKFPDQILISEDKPGEISVFSLPGITRDVKEEIEGFFAENTVYHEVLMLDEGVGRFIQTHARDEVDQFVQGAARGKTLKISFESVGKVSITGTKENLKAGKEKIMEMEKRIQKQQRTIQKEGVKLYIGTSKGKECIEKAEKEAKCVIELKDLRKQRAEEGSKGKGGGKKRQNFHQLTKCATVRLSWGVKVKVFGGDITELKVDVMVNAANSGLKHIGGLAAAIVKKGGNKIQEECAEHVKKNGNLSDGDVFMSSAGTLKCKAIAHAVGPVWKDGKSGEQKILEKAIGNCLQEAKKMKAESVAFPALSAGIFGFPAEQACTSVVNAIFSFFDEQKGGAGMKEVYVSDISKHTVSCFIQALEKKVGRDKVQVSVDFSKEGSSSVIHQAGDDDDDDAEDHNDVDENISIASTEVKFGQTRIEVVKAVLAKEYSDVIMNSVINELNLNEGQLSKSLLKEGGKEIQEECNSSYPNGIQFGDIAITGAGKLPSKKIFHVSVTPWDGRKDSAPVVRDVILKCLDEASKLKMKSISFPPVGAGGRRYPKHLVAKEMLQAMHDFCQKNQTTSIRNIRIAVYHKDSEILQEFEDVKRTWLQRQGGSGGDSVKRATKGKSWSKEKKVIDERREFMIEKLKVCIYEGDITEENVDVIVNGSNGNLDLRRGKVSRAILSKAGGRIISECNSQKVAMLNDGVAVTSGGNMQCKNIVHILAQESAQTWKPYILKSLLMAKDIKAQSIAFPALGTGRGCTAEEMAEVMLDAIQEFLAQVKGKRLMEEVRIVIFQGDMVPVYLTKFAEAESDKREFVIDKLKVYIYEGDITEENADIIVNGSNVNLDLRKGKVSRAILEKAGRGLISELKSQQAAMSSDGVAITSGGNMKCKNIVHILAQESAQTWKPYILKSLLLSESVKAQSIAFPALGTGRGCPAKDMAVIMLDTIRDFLTQVKGKHHMQELRIVIFQKDMVQAFLMKFAGVATVCSDMAAKSRKDGGKSELFQGNSNLNVVIYAGSKKGIDKAVKIVETTMDNDWTSKSINDPGIKHLKPAQREEIIKTGKENKVYLKIDEKQGEIQVMGLFADILPITDRIHQILREQVQKYHEHKEAQLLKNMVKWFYIKDKKEVEFPTDRNMMIEKAFQAKSKNFKLLGRSGEEFEIDFEKMVERPVKDPKTKFPVIRRDLIRDAIQVENPKHWTDMKSNENVKVITLQSSDPQYTKVVNEFQQSVGSRRQIVKVERIQNVTLYTQYSAKMKQLDIQNSHKKNERILWHGTAVDAVDSINTHGFNRSYCGKNAVAIGNGVYFAVHASYSAQDTYSRPDGNRHKRMYQCRVLTGDFAQGGGGMRVPPQKSSKQAHILYDSVVDNTQSPTMFVIFHDAQAYPDYLITFT